LLALLEPGCCAPGANDVAALKANRLFMRVVHAPVGVAKS